MLPPDISWKGPSTTSGPNAEGVREEENSTWYSKMTSFLPSLDTEALVDQLLLREGRVLKKGWLTFYDRSKPHGEKRYFVLRDKSFLYFQDETVQDQGTRLFSLKGLKITYQPPRNVSLDGKEYSIRSGFLAQDKLMRELEFECEDENDAGHWVQAFCLIESVQLLSNVPDFAGQESGEGGEGADAQGVASSRYPHESEYGGGKNYVSAPYIGGKSIFEPQVLFDKDATNSDSEWRCWPSGPLPPNDRIIGSDQNMCSWSLDQGVRVDATESNGRVGIGIGLKQAHQGVEISEGKFGVQISEISSGGTAEAARQEGKLRVGDFIISVDGWSCAQRHTSEVAEKLSGEEGTKVEITVARLVGPHRLWAQPNWWLQLGVVRFKCTLRRAKMKPPRSVFEQFTDKLLLRH